MKKTIAMLAALGMSAGLVACKKKNNEKPKPRADRRAPAKDAKKGATSRRAPAPAKDAKKAAAPAKDAKKAAKAPAKDAKKAPAKRR